MSQSSFLQEFSYNLLSGLRLLLPLRVTPSGFHVSHAQAVALFSFMILLDIAGDWFDVEPQREFNIYGVSFLATLYFFYLISLYLITLLENHRQTMIALMVMTLAPYPFIYLLDALLHEWLLVEMTIDDRVNWGVFALISCLVLVASGRAMHLLYQPHTVRLVVYLAIFSIFNIGVFFIVPSQALWFGRMSHAASLQTPSINVEDTFYSQPRLMSIALSSVMPGNPYKTELFYLGYSPDASQDVFFRESRSVQQLINEKFNASSHSLVLLNHKSTYRNAPLATNYNLAHALAAYSRKMDDEDVLFLYLTSHGAKTKSKNHALTASFWPLQLNDLSATKLGRLLDLADIRWRIIVVSACFSGGFIDALKSPETLIITASAFDKESFGCSYTSHYTHFAKAYFDEALREKDTFIDAFHDAAERIWKKENRQGLEHSEPQIFIGEAIREKLKEL